MMVETIGIKSYWSSSLCKKKVVYNKITEKIKDVNIGQLNGGRKTEACWGRSA